MVRQKCTNNNNPGANHRRLVCELERILWKQSKHDVDVYSDMSTMQSRLQSLMVLLSIQRSKKQNTVSSSSTSSLSSSSSMKRRTTTLITLMGRQRYEKAKMLVGVIKQSKLEYMAKHTKNCCSNSKTCCSRPGSPPPPTLPSLLPRPVKKLYFSTRLVPVFEKVPIDRLANVEWERLLEEAQQNLEAFQGWNDQHTKQKKHHVGNTEC
jgi:hypothetical protein